MYGEGKKSLAELKGDFAEKNAKRQRGRGAKG
jgi:hypothetical protein